MDSNRKGDWPSALVRGLGWLGFALAAAALFVAARRNARLARPSWDYSDRSGFGRPLDEMRGIAVGEGRP